MALTFYSERNTCGLATHIALEEAGADYALKRVAFASGEQRSPEYLAVNPKGRVPALVTPRGVLTETPALLAFLAQSYTQARLAPLDDPFVYADMLAFLSFLCATVHVAHAHRPRGGRWADEPASHEDMKRKSPANMRDAFRLIEARMFCGPWAMGEAYSVADPYLFTIGAWLPMHNIDIGEFPVLAEHAARMRARPAVARALAMIEG